MTIILIVLIIAFALATAVALVRGLMAFHSDGERLRANDAAQALAIGEQQNRMMTQRVMFQAVAVLLVALIGALAAGG